MGGQGFQQGPRPTQDSLRHPQKLQRMTCGGHIDHHSFGASAQETENTEYCQYLIHPRRNDLQQFRQELPLKAQIYVNPGNLSGRCFLDAGPDFSHPLFEQRFRIHLRCAKLPVAKHRLGAISNLFLKDIIQRRRRIHGTDFDRGFHFGPRVKPQTRRNRSLPHATLAHHQ